jgi:hypothetical protein
VPKFITPCPKNNNLNSSLYKLFTSLIYKKFTTGFHAILIREFSVGCFIDEAMSVTCCNL